MQTRPVLVWVIFIYTLIAVGFFLFGSILTLIGAIPVKLGPLFLPTLLIEAVHLAAGISLFMLRKIAVALFITYFALIILSLALQFIVTGSAAFGGGLLGVMLAWIIVIAIILYALSLEKNGILQ